MNIKKIIKIHPINIEKFFELKQQASEKNLCIKQYLNLTTSTQQIEQNHEIERVLYIYSTNPNTIVKNYDFSDEDFTFYIFKNITFESCNFKHSNFGFALFDNSQIKNPLIEGLTTNALPLEHISSFEHTIKNEEDAENVNTQREIHNLYQDLIKNDNNKPKPPLGKYLYALLRCLFYFSIVISGGYFGLGHIAVPTTICILLTFELYVYYLVYKEEAKHPEPQPPLIFENKELLQINQNISIQPAIEPIQQNSITITKIENNNNNNIEQNKTQPQLEKRSSTDSNSSDEFVFISNNNNNHRTHEDKKIYAKDSKGKDIND